MRRHRPLLAIQIAAAILTLCACGGGNEARRLPASGFVVEFPLHQIPATMTAAESRTADVTVRNASKQTWRSQPNVKNIYQVNLSYRWKDSKGRVLVADGARTPLPRDLAPGETVQLKMNITAPGRAGRYILNATMLQEGNAWFDDKGGAALAIPVTVSALTAAPVDEPQSTTKPAAGAAREGKKRESRRATERLAAEQKSASQAPANPAREVKAPPADANKAAADSWFVQVGSFPERKSAEKIAKKLTDNGYDVFVAAAEISRKKHYRVRVGHLASRAEAERLQQSLRQKENLSQTIVAKQ